MAGPMSKDEAVAWVKKEMGFTKEMSETIVANVDQNQDGHIDQDELNLLKSITTESKEHLKERFAEYDYMGTGLVSKSEAKMILLEELKGMSDFTINPMLCRYDKDGNNKFDVDEFIMFYSYVQAKKPSVTKCFAKLDVDGDKQLSMDELVGVMQDTLWIDYTTACDMLRDMGVDGEGKTMTVEQFKEHWKSFSG